MLQVKHLATASIVLLIFAGASSRAQVPDEETKIRALNRAYQLNGNSMVRWGSIDLSGGPVPPDNAICVQIDGPATGQQFFECRQPVKTERITPIAKAEDKNEIDQQADNIDKVQQKWVRLRGDRNLPNNICEEHHMRKVVTGDSWRCRK